MGALSLTYGELYVLSNYALGVLQDFVFLVQGLDTTKNESIKGVSQMSSLWCCVISVLNAILLVYFSPSNITATHGFIIQIGLSLLFSKMILHIQIASISGQRFHQWRLSFLLGYGFYILNNISGILLGQCLVNEKLAIAIVSVIAVVAYTHTVYSISNHIAELLNIRIFKIGKLKETTKRD